MSRSFLRQVSSWRLSSGTLPVALATGMMLSLGGVAELAAQCPGGYNPPPPTKGRGNNSSPGPSTPGPSGPSTPGPASPSTPGPGVPGPPTGGPSAPGPTTGGPPNISPPGPRTGAPSPAAPRAGGRRGGGIPLTFDRGHTSKEFLDIDWDYPVYDPAAEYEGSNETRAIVRAALPVDRVFEELAGDDRRPLLVVRECLSCVGSDAALLSKNANNERTVLLTGWFHCVKLPPHVVDFDHPFHNLFGEDHETHLFLSSWDGSGRVELDGTQSQSKLWKAMTEVLRRDYEGNADKAVKELLKLLNQFDRVDGLEAELMHDLDRLLERTGGDSPKIRRVQAKLKAVAEERKELMEEAKELRQLGLRAPEPEAEPADAGK